MTDAQQEEYLKFSGQEMREQEESVDRQEQETRQKQMHQLNKLLEMYSMENFHDDVRENIEETKASANYEGQNKRRIIDEVIALVHQMQQQHSDSLEMPCDEVIGACFKAYGAHLGDLEARDIKSLRKRIGELKSMQRNLGDDLKAADQLRTSLLQERDQELIPNNYSTMERRGGIGGLQGKINSKRNDIEGFKERLPMADQEELEELKQGNDQLHEVNQ